METIHFPFKHHSTRDEVYDIQRNYSTANMTKSQSKTEKQKDLQRLALELRQDKKLHKPLNYMVDSQNKNTHIT